MSELAKWYVVHTYSGYENSVAANILKAAENRKMQDLIQEVNIPMETVKEITDSGEKTVERKVFPGYVLVKMVLTDESWHLVHNVRGAAGFVGSDGKAIPLTEQEIVDNLLQEGCADDLCQCTAQNSKEHTDQQALACRHILKDPL